eukprot:jgi/Mesvir1/20047/Mv13298-RA.1
MNDTAGNPPGLWMSRKASPREAHDVIKAVESVCRSYDIPRPYISFASSTKDLVSSFGKDTYVMTEFRKGVYGLLALVRVRGGRTVCAIVHGDRTVEIIRMPPFKTKLFKGTVACGILASEPSGRSTFYLHDCLAFARKSLMATPFKLRMIYARQMVEMNFPAFSSYTYTHS